MAMAGLITVICHRFKQPIVLGYIIAGMIIGPYTPPFSLISNEETVKTLAELGVVFLMFSLGLEFNLYKLSRVGLSAFSAAFAEIVLMIGIGYEIGCWFQWSTIDSIFLGAILAISSTTIIVKALNELKMKHQPFAQLIFGILIIEDIFAILILTLLSSIALTGSLNTQEVVISATKLLSFLVVSLLLGLLIVPKLIQYIARFESDEMLLISVLGMCFGFCLLVVKLDYSIALGAFVIGAVMAESRVTHKIEVLISPLRDMFSAIFFVSVGLLFNPEVLFQYWLPISVITVAVVFGKVITCGLGVLITGKDGKTAMKTGMGLAQIGEFSFIIASLGITLDVTSDFLFPIAVAVSAITTLLTPYLIRYSDHAAALTACVIPQKIQGVFSLYQNWLQDIQPSPGREEQVQLIRRSIFQVIVNLFIVIAIFLAFAFFANTELVRKTYVFLSEDVKDTLTWGIALTCALPFILVAYKKMKVTSNTLAEFGSKNEKSNHLSNGTRRVIAEVIPIISIVGIMVLISALSISILPPLHLLIVVLIFVAALIAFLSPWCIRLHARLKAHLLDTIKKDEGE